MISNSAKLDSRTKQHTQSGVSTSDGSRDMAPTKSWRKKKKKNERRQSHKASPTGIANDRVMDYDMTTQFRVNSIYKKKINKKKSGDCKFIGKI